MSVSLRKDLLTGRVVVTAGGGAAPPTLGGEVVALDPDLDVLDEEAVLAAAPVRVDTLVADARSWFAAPGAGVAGLRRALDGAWNVVRATAAAAMIPDSRGGEIVLIAPAPDAGPGAAAARAGLENMARTLSIEWSRFGVRTVALAPGTATTETELQALLAYLASPAGDYFSGARISLGQVR